MIHGIFLLMLLNCQFFFFVMIRIPPLSTLFPYTTLFRSCKLTAEYYRRHNGCISSRSYYVVTGVWGVNFCSKRSEEHTSELQSRRDLVCRLLLEKKKSLLQEFVMLHTCFRDLSRANVVET